MEPIKIKAPTAVAKWREKVLLNPFEPRFEWVDTVELCADMINRPHEDYPVRVGLALTAVNRLVAFCQTYGGQLVEVDSAKICHFLMWCDYNPRKIPVGKLRPYDVWVGTQRCPPHWVVPHLLDFAFPVVAKGEEALVEWYRIFQSIHPFADGNGRVGGVIVAALSFLETGRYMAPLQ